MGKRFAEHGGLNLTQVNNDVLQTAVCILRGSSLG